MKESQGRVAGRQLDCEIAERVMGYVWRKSSATARRCIYAPDRWPVWMDSPAVGTEPLVGDWEFGNWTPNYSTSIADAFSVVEKMREKEWDFSLNTSQDGTTTVSFCFRWDAERWDDDDASKGCYEKFAHAFHVETPSLAICLAALKALEAASPDKAPLENQSPSSLDATTESTNG